MAFNQDANEFHWLMDMLESVEVGLVVLDLDFHVQAWNGFMEHHSGITARQIRDKVLFEVFPDIPEAWLTRKVDAVAMLNTRAFTSWEQRPYLFKFRNTRPITGTEEYMFQNLTISPTGLLHPAIDGFYIGERMLLICRYRCTNVTICCM